MIKNKKADDNVDEHENKNSHGDNDDNKNSIATTKWITKGDVNDYCYKHQW